MIMDLRERMREREREREEDRERKKQKERERTNKPLIRQLAAFMIMIIKRTITLHQNSTLKICIHQ